MSHRRRGVLPFDADHLADPEKALQLAQEHRTCLECGWLGEKRRSGTRHCENPREYDPGPVLAGDVACDGYIAVKLER
jgi:hypothetical protein